MDKTDVILRELTEKEVLEKKLFHILGGKDMMHSHLFLYQKGIGMLQKYYWKGCFLRARR